LQLVCNQAEYIWRILPIEAAMNSDAFPTLQRRVRILEIYTGVVTLVLAVVGVTAFTRPSQPTSFDEINVKRINIVEDNGLVRMAISNTNRSPGWVFHGKVVPGRPKNAGMIFFNDEGEENGGFIYSGRKVNDSIRAAMSLTFDQYDQDQVIALQYIDEGGLRRQGLSINDYPRSPTLEQYAITRIMPEGPEKKAAQARLDSIINAAGGYGRNRAYFGRDRKASSILELSDAKGHARLRLSVDSTGHAQIVFLDSAGKGVKTIAQ
jgi:hypothetical protein